jgi:ABC transport system ATP-binding/permease protein
MQIKIGGRIYSGFNFKFDPGRKIGVVGPNGAGKTTFLKMILGDIHPFEGVIETGENVQFNYIDQARLHLNDEDTVINAIGEGSEVSKFGKQKMPVWTYLRRFLFTDDRINTQVGKLSGGEKSRLTLAKILSFRRKFYSA